MMNTNKNHLSNNKNIFNGRIMRAIIYVGLITLLFPGQLLAQDDSNLGLEFISYTTKSGSGIEIQLNMDGEAPPPASFTTKRPARITLDLPDVKNNLPWTLPLPIKNGGMAKSISVTEASGRTRVVINLDELVPYTTRIDGNTINISITDSTVTGVGQEDQMQDVTEMDTPVEEPIPAETTEIVEEPPLVIQKAESADAKTSNAIEGIDYSSLPSGRVQVRIKLSKETGEPNSFTISDPARLVLDFADTGNKLDWSTKDVGVGILNTIAAIAAGNRTRVVLGLTSIQPFETEVHGRDIILTLEGELTAKAKSIAGAEHLMKEIDFRRGDAGEGRVIVKLSDRNVSVDTREEGGKIIVEFMNTELPEELVQRLDVIDFATPVRFIDTTQADGNVKLVITPQGNYQHIAYQANNIYTLDVKALTKKELALAKATYTGEKLSLNFQDIEVRAVLQLIADFTGLNLVASDSVGGSITLRLKDVPWDQAMDIILKTKGLGMRRKGNIMLVAPAEELAAREKIELEAAKTVVDLEPLRTELITVSYAKASEIAALLKSEGNSLLTERGSVTVDERTNTLLINETGGKLADIRKLVTKLDIPIRQVLIESRVVIADDSFSKDLGVKFGINGVDTNSNGDVFTASSKSFVSGAMLNSGSVTSALLSGDNRMNVNMPVIGNAGTFAFGFLGSNELLDLELTALKTEGRGEVVSSPRVITSNKNTATIEQGTEIPYATVSDSGTQIEFKKAVLSLQVTPQITPDDRIALDLRVTKDSPGETAGGIPPINTKRVETQVLVDNGQTVVLGGVYEQTIREDIAKVPFFGDLPLIGFLFTNKHNEDEKNELLIFVTPKILKEGVSTFDQ